MDIKKLLIVTLCVLTPITFVSTFYVLLRQETVAQQALVLPAPILLPSPVTPEVWDTEQARSKIDEADCKEILGWLASDEREGRMSGKAGNKETADYIKKKFEGFGYQTSLQQFPIRRVNPGPKKEMGDDFTNN